MTGYTVEFVNCLNHVHWNTNGAGLIGNRSGDRLTDPPGCIGGEFVTATILKLVYCFHQTDIAFLNQIQKLQTTVSVFFGDGDNQTQVSLNHFFLGATGHGFTHGHAAIDIFNLRDVHVGKFFNLCQFAL